MSVRLQQEDWASGTPLLRFARVAGCEGWPHFPRYVNYSPGLGPEIFSLSQFLKFESLSVTEMWLTFYSSTWRQPTKKGRDSRIREAHFRWVNVLQYQWACDSESVSGDFCFTELLWEWDDVPGIYETGPAMQWIFMPHHIHMLKPSLPGDGISGRGLGHEAGALLNGISATVNSESSLAPSHPVRTQQKDGLSMNQEVMPHQTLNLVEPRSWTSQCQKLRDECLLFKPASVW